MREDLSSEVVNMMDWSLHCLVMKADDPTTIRVNIVEVEILPTNYGST